MKQNIKELIFKLSQGKCNEEEIDLLLEYFNSPDLKQFELEIKREWDSNGFAPVSKEKIDEVWSRIQLKLKPEFNSNRKAQKIKKGTWRDYYKYAAIFIGVALLSVFIFKNSIVKTEQTDAITVEFSDGSVEKLVKGGTDILKEPGLVFENDKLQYKSNSSKTDKLEYNTIRIPFGRKFELVLSDGTEVHLNSGTSLKYPVKFIEGTERNVYLEGEAFFKVAKNKDRFMVNTDNLKTEVLGTEFNVSSYPMDTKKVVVLLEGSVKVHGKGSQVLRPNEKLTLIKETGNWEIEKVNARDYISWIDGVLWFRNENFSEIVPKLERHFNVKISNEFRELENKKFTGRFETEEITEVLKVFKTAIDFDYEISEKLISIENPKSKK